MAQLTDADLVQLIGAAKVDELSDDNGDGIRDDGVVEGVLAQAEDFGASFLLKGWSREQIDELIRADASLRTQFAWIACEMLSERRPQFLAADGKGAYWAQYERAQAYLTRLSKAKGHSVGEATAGASAQRGGRINPPRDALEPTHTFAPSKNNPRGSGGF
jgi:hypothetical protein